MVIETILDEQGSEKTVCEEDMTNGQKTEATDDQAGIINDRAMESAIVNDGDEEEAEPRGVIALVLNSFLPALFSAGSFSFFL